MADDDRSQAYSAAIRVFDHTVLFHWSNGHRDRPAGAVDANWRSRLRRYLQQAFHAAWDRDGLVLSGAVDPRHLRQFSVAADGRPAQRTWPFRV